jgi:hypothetical protein
MGIGSFTAMNLTGGNPITAVGLDNYTTKINAWFRTPQSLKDKRRRRTGRSPARGEPSRCRTRSRRRSAMDLLGAYFGICGEIVDAGLVTIADFNMGLELALDMKPAFTYMNELGTKKRSSWCGLRRRSTRASRCRSASRRTARTTSRSRCRSCCAKIATASRC